MPPDSCSVLSSDESCSAATTITVPSERSIVPITSMCSSSSASVSSGSSIETLPITARSSSGNVSTTPTSAVTSVFGVPQVIRPATPKTRLPSASGNHESSCDTISSTSFSGSSGNRIASTAPLESPPASASTSIVRFTHTSPPTPERKKPKPSGIDGNVRDRLQNSAQPSGSPGSCVSTTTTAARPTATKSSAAPRRRSGRCPGRSRCSRPAGALQLELEADARQAA